MRDYARGVRGDAKDEEGERGKKRKKRGKEEISTRTRNAKCLAQIYCNAEQEQRRNIITARPPGLPSVAELELRCIVRSGGWRGGGEGSRSNARGTISARLPRPSLAP